VLYNPSLPSFPWAAPLSEVKNRNAEEPEGNLNYGPTFVIFPVTFADPLKD